VCRCDGEGGGIQGVQLVDSAEGGLQAACAGAC
jgi:hypothetical protein